jgi:SAM-dependent methyltransferase
MDPTERFSTRAEEYESARPSYPREVITLMRDALDLAPHHAIADIGSGTGILSRLFLDCGNTVFGVEPNAAMRAVAQDTLDRYRRFRSVDGRAEESHLADRSVDFIVVGQALHWFEISTTAREFRRVLKPAGWVVIVWNERRVTGLPFLVEYEAFLERWGTDYLEVRARYDLEPQLSGLFERHDHRAFGNAQELDPRGLRARLLSSSYVPPPDDPQREPMLAALDKLFQEHQVDGRVRIEYDTHVYYGRLKT